MRQPRTTTWVIPLLPWKLAQSLIWSQNASPSPAYEAKGLKLNLVLLSKSDQAPAPAYTEKPCSLVGLALRGKPSQAAPEEISKVSHHW
jgi:hypothetical protein